MIAVGDLGAVLRWVGLVPGPAPALRRLVAADTGLPLATTSTEIADLAAPHVGTVLVV